jgi:hypothetical protein
MTNKEMVELVGDVTDSPLEVGEEFSKRHVRV